MPCCVQGLRLSSAAIRSPLLSFSTNSATASTTGTHSSNSTVFFLVRPRWQRMRTYEQVSNATMSTPRVQPERRECTGPYAYQNARGLSGLDSPDTLTISCPTDARIRRAPIANAVPHPGHYQGRSLGHSQGRSPGHYQGRSPGHSQGRNRGVHKVHPSRQAARIAGADRVSSEHRPAADNVT